MPQGTGEPSGRHWVDIWAAVAMVRKRLGCSVGAAQALLCEACASRMVRWRRGDSRFAIPIGLSCPLTREVWRSAHIDLNEGQVVHGQARYRVEISKSDLAYWLSTPGAARSEAKTGNTANNDEGAPFWVTDEILEWARNQGLGNI